MHARTSDLLALEADVDAALTDRRQVGYFDTAWLEPAGRWAEAIWQAAERLGPLPLDAEDLALAERAAPAPIFVCGAPRSGTTLMRDLLDGHPALAILPGEGRWFGNWEHRPGTGTWAREWLERLANPMNQPPYWLLGRSGAESPYLRFARALMAWTEALHPTPCPRLTALALTLTEGRDKSAIRYWADKTPGYEVHLDTIWARFPQAKVIAMVRRPEAVAASYATGVARGDVRTAPTATMLRSLARSYAATRRAVRRAPAGQLLLVSHEALADDRAGTMAHVADFIGIGWHDSLIRQEILGHPADPNTSFFGMARLGFSPASPPERIWLTLAKWRHRQLV